MARNEYVTRLEYDREMAALKGEIDALKSIISTMQRSNVSNRVADLEVFTQP